MRDGNACSPFAVRPPEYTDATPDWDAEAPEIPDANTLRNASSKSEQSLL